MIFNLLTSLTDPNGIPSGYGSLKMGPLWTILITIIAIAITLISAYIIYYLVKNNNNEIINNKKWIKPTIIITTIVLTILLIILGCLACTAD